MAARQWKTVEDGRWWRATHPTRLIADTLPACMREVLTLGKSIVSYLGPCRGTTPIGRRYLTVSACTCP